MAPINQQLLEQIKKRTGLAAAAVYKRISKVSAQESLPRDLAAIRVGAEAGLSINKYATREQLQELRGRGLNGTAAPAAAAEAPRPARKVSVTRTAKSKPKDGRTVFVVHGRDNVARDDMFTFLRALGLHPLEWTEAIELTKKAAPYVGEILDAAFERATAVVVLMTPDDEVQLRPDLLKRGDDATERKLTGQARPNVLFEAGLAFGSHPNQTVLVELGKMRPFSDVGGRHTIRMTGSATSRHALAARLRRAGCKVETDARQDWLNAGKFEDPLKRKYR